MSKPMTPGLNAAAAPGLPLDPAQWRRFILDNTELLPPPLVPEIRLHLAAESLPIWRKTEEELGQLNLPPPFWAFAWAGGQALARYLLDGVAAGGAGPLRGKAVLDLGAGSGLTAIAAMLAGAARVLAADVDAIALEAVLVNAAANEVTVATTMEDLLIQPPDPAFDVILVGDLFYERALAENVLTFCEAAARRGALVLVGDPQRSYFPRGKFEQVASYRVPVTRELEDSEIKNTAVWRVPG